MLGNGNHVKNPNLRGKAMWLSVCPKRLLELMLETLGDHGSARNKVARENHGKPLEYGNIALQLPRCVLQAATLLKSLTSFSWHFGTSPWGVSLFQVRCNWFLRRMA